MSDTTETTMVGMSASDLEAQIQEVKDIACTLLTFAGSGDTLGEVVGFDMAIDKIGNRLSDVADTVEKAGYGFDGRPAKTAQDAPCLDGAGSDGHRLIYQSAEDARDGLRSIALDLREGTAGADVAERVEDAAGWLDFEVDNEGMKFSEAVAISKGTGVTLDRLCEIVCPRPEPEEI